MQSSKLLRSAGVPLDNLFLTPPSPASLWRDAWNGDIITAAETAEEPGSASSFSADRIEVCTEGKKGKLVLWKQTFSH